MLDPRDRKACLGCFVIKPMADFPERKGAREATCRACLSDRAQVRKHGVTKAQKDAMAAEQGGCLTCRRTDPGAKGWVMDHDRTHCGGDTSCSRCRRGVLCQWCNSALGYARDDPAVLRRMADYLEAHQRVGLAIGPPSRSTESGSRIARTDGDDGLTKRATTSGDMSPSVTHARAWRRTEEIR